MDSTKIASMILRNVQSLHRPIHEFRVVDGSSFSHVSKRFYRSVEDKLASQGFSKLGDIEDVTVAKYGNPNPRTFLRVLKDTNRTTIVGICHVAPIWWWRVAMWCFGVPEKFIEFQSHSENCFWLTTTNVTPKVHLPRPDDMLIEYTPRKHSAEQMYLRHCESLSRFNRRYKRFQTIEDVIEFEIELHARKRDYLVSIGWVTPEYLAAQGVPASHVDDVYAETQRLLRTGFDASENH